MSSSPSPGSSHSAPTIPAKRKWTSKMMKTWVATDPSLTEPVVHHGDKKAAARLERKKKQRIDHEAAKLAPPTHRLIYPPNHARAPPPQPKLDLDGLFSFFDDNEGTKDEPDTITAGAQNVATPATHQDEVHGSHSIADGADMTPDDAGPSENADLRKEGHVPQGGDRTAAQADTCGGHPPLGSHQVHRGENDNRDWNTQLSGIVRPASAPPYNAASYTFNATSDNDATTGRAMIGDRSSPSRSSFSAGAPLTSSTFTRRDIDIRMREKAVNSREDFVHERKAAVDKREQEVNRREVTMKTREASVNKREHTVHKREVAIDNREAAVDNREAAVNNREDAADKRDEAVRIREDSVAMRAHASELRLNDIERREAEAAALQHTLGDREVALAKREVHLNMRANDLDKRMNELDTRHNELINRADDLAMREEALTRLEGDMKIRCEDLEKRLQAVAHREVLSAERHDALEKREEATATREEDITRREEALRKGLEALTLRKDAHVGHDIPVPHMEGKGDGAESFNVGWRKFGPQGRDIILWPTNLVTTTPFVPDVRRGKRGRNKLKWDCTYVKTVARTFKSSRDRPDLCVHATFTTREAAFKLIAECTANGKPLVFDNFPDSVAWAQACTSVDDDPFMNPLTWSIDRLEGVVGANVLTPRDFQDAPLREKNPLAPYATATLLDFHAWLKMPDKVRCILDLTCGFPQRDNVTDRIADNVIETISSTPGNRYSGHFNVAADIMKTLDWFLLHTAGFLTFGHIDASGMATSAEIRGGGLKEWFIFVATNMPKPQPGDTRLQRRRVHARLILRVLELIQAASTDSLEAPKSVHGVAPDWQVDGCIIELRPGMKYYQPAGTVHGAFTPVPTAAAGKHYFTYDDLHRMEVSRRVQIAKDGVTNHNHNCGVQLMLISMAAALPIRSTTGQVFYRKPMIAMALMLVRPKDYIKEAEAPEQLSGDDDKETKAKNAERLAEYTMTERLRSDTWAEEGTAFDRLAYTVATTILIACKTKYPGDSRAKAPGPEYILEGERWDDPGPPLDVRGLMDDLRVKHVDEVTKRFAPSDSEPDSEAESDSESDLTDLD
ncbi:uncharacterized protein SCHCODRAFT_02673618 [Schizophyllum commune H4-8]|uniref:JmjC domain-containing protein n=1 Tax=Schizophyllum commune (strain H4-8 / FGSC 9210) TaxID=578458 RepID=D8QKU1_SCHCM|nr:uncharacterized protein SCHCODRAFT_02673618 [Schizophyllum commune H4-8]KAI5885434.1 hypothetical protein SCHCODRAFT_02673618 [Schizophyllum commune H4-8]